MVMWIMIMLCTDDGDDAGNGDDGDTNSDVDDDMVSAGVELPAFSRGHHP